MLVRTVFVNNAKLALVGVAAFALGGAGTVASVTLSGSHTPAPASSHATETEDGTETEAKEANEAKDEDAGDTGVRPTDTRGYCVSRAVAAGHAAGKKGKDLAAAKALCPKPAKSNVSHGQSTKPHGKASTHS